MKVKLLKKLHKRYKWYFNSKKIPILIDTYKKIVIIYDNDTCAKKSGIEVNDIPIKIKCTVDEWQLRHIKFDLLSKYGWNWQKSIYRTVLNKYKHKISNNLK